MGFVNDMTHYSERLYRRWCFYIHKVINLTTLFAIEMNMWMNVSIVANAMLINGNHLRCMMLGEKTESIVNCGTAER